MLHTKSAANCNQTAPGIGCPCIAEASPQSGACAAGFICRKVSSAQQSHAQPNNNDTAKCWPCSFGQYCPAGSYLPDDPSSLPQAVEQYTCRYQNLPYTSSNLEWNLCDMIVRCLQDWSLLPYSTCDAAMPTGQFLLPGDLQLHTMHQSAI